MRKEEEIMGPSKSYLKNTYQNIVKTGFCINLPSKSVNQTLRNAFTIPQISCKNVYILLAQDCYPTIICHRCRVLSWALLVSNIMIEHELSNSLILPASYSYSQ